MGNGSITIPAAFGPAVGILAENGQADLIVSHYLSTLQVGITCVHRVELVQPMSVIARVLTARTISGVRVGSTKNDDERSSLTWQRAFREGYLKQFYETVSRPLEANSDEEEPSANANVNALVQGLSVRKNI